MSIISILAGVMFTWLVVALSIRVFAQEQQNIRDEFARGQKDLEDLHRSKQAVIRDKERSAEEMLKNFTLYDITKEIAKTLHEEEAFNVFKQKLAQHLSCRECHYITKQQGQMIDGYFVYNLKSRGEEAGCIALKGISEEDQEKAVILGHQFALALQRIRLYEEIERLAITDSLSGVYTRRYFQERLEEEISRVKLRKTEVSLLMIDVDHFKSINDTYGHLTGDQVLREAGKLIRDNIREIDIAGRYGGEEFAVVLPESGTPGAIQAAERIRYAVEKATIHAYDANLKITISIGLATYPTDCTSISELFDKADWALYRAKNVGRNQVCAFGVFKK